MIGAPGQFAIKVLEDTGTVLLLPSPCLSVALLQLTPKMLSGPVTYIGADEAFWTLPSISASELAAGGSLVGRQIHIHNGSGLTMNLNTATETFGRSSGIEALTITANGSVGLIGQNDPSTGLNFWQPTYLNGVTLAAKGAIVPGPGALQAAGQLVVRAP